MTRYHIESDGKGGYYVREYSIDASDSTPKRKSDNTLIDDWKSALFFFIVFGLIGSGLGGCGAWIIWQGKEAFYQEWVYGGAIMTALWLILVVKAVLR